MSLITVTIPAHWVTVPEHTFMVPERTMEVEIKDELPPDPGPPDPGPPDPPDPSPLPKPLVDEPFSDQDLAGRDWVNTTPAWPFVTDDELGRTRPVLRLQFVKGQKVPVGTRYAAMKVMTEHVAEFTHAVKIKPVLLQTVPSVWTTHFLGTINDMDMRDNGVAINNPFLAESSGRFYMDWHDDKYCGSINANRVGGAKWPKFYSPAKALRQGVWNQIVTHFKHNTVGLKNGIYRVSARYLEAGAWSDWAEIINIKFGNFILEANRNSAQSWVTIEPYSRGEFAADFRLADLSVYPGDLYRAVMASPEASGGLQAAPEAPPDPVEPTPEPTAPAP